MKRVFNYFIFTFFIFILFLCKVNADCSYQDRKQMLSDAKNVQAFFDVDLDNNKIVFNLYNLTDDLFVELRDLSTNQSFEIYNYQLTDGMYQKDIDNVDTAVTYRLYINSNRSECYGNSVTNKTLTKGIINKYYNDDVCLGIEDYTYCKPVLNKNTSLTDEQIYKKIEEYKKSIQVKEETEIVEVNVFINFLNKYWKYVVVVLSMIVLLLYP